MRRWLNAWLTAALALGAPAQVFAGGASSDDLVVIVNSGNRIARLSMAELEMIFTLRQRHWSDGSMIVPVNFPPGDDRRTAFDRAVTGMPPEEVGRFWLDQRIRSGIRPPRHVSNADLAARFVLSVRGAIAYVPASAVTPDVRAVARIVKGKVVGL